MWSDTEKMSPSLFHCMWGSPMSRMRRSLSKKVDILPATRGANGRLEAGRERGPLVEACEGAIADLLEAEDEIAKLKQQLARHQTFDKWSKATTESFQAWTISCATDKKKVQDADEKVQEVVRACEQRDREIAGQLAEGT